jgi:hypothetical protein
LSHEPTLNSEAVPWQWIAVCAPRKTKEGKEQKTNSGKQWKRNKKEPKTREAERRKPKKLIKKEGMQERIICLPPLCPDRLCGPPSLLSNRYRELFPRKKSGREREADHSPPAFVRKVTFVCSTFRT